MNTPSLRSILVNLKNLGKNNMYQINETKKIHNKAFNEKYTLVFSYWGIETVSGYRAPLLMKLRNNETNEYIDLHNTLQHMLNPLYLDTVNRRYFITYEEDIKIKLAINLIKTMINF